MHGEYLGLRDCVVPIGVEGTDAWADPSAYHVAIYLRGLILLGPTGIHSLLKRLSAGGRGKGWGGWGVCRRPMRW